MPLGTSPQHLFAVVVVSACWFPSSLVAGVVFPIQAADKEWESAALKVREGKIDEAYGLIKPLAAKNPDGPPSFLILALSGGEGARKRSSSS